MDAWVVEVLRKGYMIPFARVPPLSDLPLSASLFPILHQGNSSFPGVSRPSPQGGHRTGSPDSRILQPSFCRPKRFWSMASHNRPLHPEHVCRGVSIPHGDSSVSPLHHSPRRLDDLRGPLGCVSADPDTPGFTPLPPLCHPRGDVPVQGVVFRPHDCPSGLYKSYGSRLPSSTSTG